MRIMIIEDDYLFLDYVASILSREGHEVWALNDSTMAFDAISDLHGKLDLVISDIWMPKCDGIEILKGLRSLYPEIKVIMITGYVTETDEKRLTDLGADAVVMKTSDRKELAAILHKFDIVSETHERIKTVKKKIHWLIASE